MHSVTTILYCVLLTSFANCLKQCDDCVKITDCGVALDRVRTDRSPETSALVTSAYCGFDVTYKVCCSDFITSRSGTPEGENVIPSGDEIENHRNINLLPAECGDIEGNRIVGGTVAGLYEFPWLALISYRVAGSLKFNCGGTVISSRYVLTAAHCIVTKNEIAGVRIGDHDIGKRNDCLGEGEMRECESRFQDIGVTHKIYHRDYSRLPAVLNDIGLLRLARPVDFSYRNAGAVCLPITKQLRETDLTGERGTVAGWGVTENQTRSNVLMKVEIPVFSTATCQSYYNNKNTQSRRPPIDRLKNTFCAGELGHDSCKGDSGGPLMLEGFYNETYRFIQYGVVSYGPSQCGSNKPGIYTDVRKFMKWILDTMKP